MKYLFLFTIGPVQSFIAQARKTHDLYMGSQLFSYLIQQALNKIMTKNNCEIIFPIINHLNSKKDAQLIKENSELKDKIGFLPNRFIVEIDAACDEDIKMIGKDMEYELKKMLREEIFEKTVDRDELRSVFKKIESHKSSNLDLQLENFLEIHWVAIPMDDDKDYVKKYVELERLLGAVKNVRKFQQLKEKGRKCSLCGERNALFYRKTQNGKKPLYIQEDAIEIADDSLKDRLKPGEGLCAVCFIKRFWKNEYFPSTAAIAASDWIEKIKEKKSELYNEFMCCFDKQQFDAQCFYKENLREDYLKKYGWFQDNDKLEYARNILKKLYRDKDGKYKEPRRYYALLMLDVDDMGRFLSGEFLSDKSQLKYFHKELSQCLYSFARNVTEEFQKSGRTVVYAGGDDFQGFINLSNLDVLSDLKDIFSKTVKNRIERKFLLYRELTYSSGIIIAHYKTPLYIILNFLRQAIDNVKNYFEAKNGTAIVFVTHSGRIIETYLKNSLLKDFLKIINDPDTSFPFLYNLDRVMSKLNWNGIFTFGELENQLDILKNEVARLLKRTLKSILPHDKYNNLLEFLLNSIKMYINKNRRNYRFDYISYINLLKISEEIKRCVKSSS